MAVFGLDAIKRRLGQGIVGSTVGGQQDPRGAQGIAARGANIYNGGSNSSKTSLSGPKNQDEGQMWAGGAPPWVFDERIGGPNPSFTSPGQLSPGSKPISNGQLGQGGNSAISVFDPQIEAIKRRLQESLALGSSNRDMARQRVGQDYTQGQSELEKAREAAMRQLQANLASNGMLRSGANIEQMGQIGEGYQSSLDELGRSRTRTLEDIDAQWAEVQRQNAIQQEMLAMEQARMNQQAALAQAQQEAQRQAAEESQRRQEEQTQQQFINVTPTGQLLPNQQRAREMTGAWGADERYYQDANQLTDRINQIFKNMEVGTAAHETEAQRIARLMDEVANGRTLDDIRLSASKWAPEGNKFAEAARRKIGQ